MKLERLRLENFRNHERTSFECSPASNMFLGGNGEGKTNILEGISFLCLTKSFYASNDENVLQVGKNMFRVSGDMQSDQGVSYDITVSFDAGLNQKVFTINNTPVEKLSSVIGQFPIVVLSPENNAITFGAPADRRKFLDLVISQASRRYFEDLLDYRRILKQRNRILTDSRIARTDCSELLAPWDENLIDRGARIIRKRAEFLREFQPYVLKAFDEIVGSSERPRLSYEASVAAEETEVGIEESFRAELDARMADERRMGSTSVGPHRDEVAFTINGFDLRKFASQGQHKTFLIGLKLAEFFYLRERCRETPVLLLDDVFSELDGHRAQRLSEAATSLGQTFVTSTDEKVVAEGAARHSLYRKFHVRTGTVSHAEAHTPVN